MISCAERRVDTLTSEERSRRMASVRQSHTEPELVVRRLMHRAGLRFRVADRRLPGSPDIVLPRWRTVVFVHGCFWHGHDCPLFKLPRTRTEWWRAKVASNINRDQRAVECLVAMGWRAITVWQCALKGKGRLASADLAAALSNAVRMNSSLTEVRGTTWMGPTLAPPASPW
jgi:DNA mismatch endonuclease (patch repair protein)